MWLSVAEKIDERESNADGDEAANKNCQHRAPERPLACRVRSHDLRSLHVSVVRRRHDVVEFDRMVTVGLDEGISFHECDSFCRK